MSTFRWWFNRLRSNISFTPVTPTDPIDPVDPTPTGRAFSSGFSNGYS